MKIIYDSLTGQGRKFASKLDHIEEMIPIYEYNNEPGPFVLITRSEDFGQIPLDVVDFLEDNAHKVIGVMACGNKNWGTNFGRAGARIEEDYGIPLIHKFELAGFSSDVSIANEWISEYEKDNQ